MSRHLDSYWSADSTTIPGAPLTEGRRVQVCVLGAGIAGLTTAYLLARQGATVAVLDSGTVGGGQTRYTTAHLASAIDDRFTEIERLHGADGSRLAAESHAAAIDWIEGIVRDEGIACDFERLDGYLHLAPEHKPDLLESERDAARRAGLSGVELLPRGPLAGWDAPCLRFPRQGQFHPLKYLAGLARALVKLGGQIHTHTHAVEVQGGRPARVCTRGGAEVTADAVVVATNSPISDRVTIHTKQAPYMSYVVAAPVPAGSVPRGLYWDTTDPYHYVRLQRSHGNGAAGELLIVGGEDHKTGQADDHAERYQRLEQWARQRFPGMREVAYSWCGQVMETVDGLGFIGRDPGHEANVFVATGDSGMGMTHGTIAGIILSELVFERHHPWAQLYDPGRKPLKAAGDFLKENLNVAGQYADWLTGGDVKSADDVPPGGGAVLRKGLTKLALYRDEGGVLHECSAVCPHMGCIVRWNDSAKTWDCPCHGSRFDPYGRVTNGPSPADLAR